MRPTNRISIVLTELEKVWREYPDLRLGQLIVNIAGVDPFYVEDDRMLSLIKAFQNRKDKSYVSDVSRI